VVGVRPRSGPARVERKDQERVVIVSANITGRDMGSILADIQEGLRSIPVPRDFSIVIGGDYEEQQKAFRELLLSFVLALVLVYMVMACLYESLRDPFVVMFSVPLAAIGVTLMLFLTNTTFNVQSFIGCIMLGGIVVNNAILLVDHTNLLRRRDGMPLREAIEEAGRRRLRPILMTAMTTALGLVPLAIGMGEGGEAQAPLARAVIGGLLSSTLITLVFVPTVYSIFQGRLGKTDTQADPMGSSESPGDRGGTAPKL
jgi:HAE1 family hydrophobic/amphiphilic exporter-1